MPDTNHQLIKIAELKGWTNITPEGLYGYRGTHPDLGWPGIPDWTRHIDKAWELVEEMGEAFHGLLRGPSDCWSVGVEGMTGGYCADSPCKAICGAYLYWKTNS